MAHENFRDLATKLITKNGLTCQLITVTNSGDEWNPTQSETEVDVIAIQLSFNSNDIDGDLVKRDDKLFLIDSSIQPSLDMKFRHKDKSYQITYIDTLEPADTTIRYKLQCRA